MSKQAEEFYAEQYAITGGERMSEEFYESPSLVLSLASMVGCGSIADAMRKYAEMVGEPASRFSCGNGCECGRNCGEDDDCFSCNEIENLYCIRWVSDGQPGTHLDIRGRIKRRVVE